MASLLVSHHRPGFYFRVLEEGEVGAGDESPRVADVRKRMSVAEIDGLLICSAISRSAATCDANSGAESGLEKVRFMR